MRRFAAEALRDQTAALLRRWRMPADRAALTARIMVDADLRGIDSHGVSMLTRYDGMVASGELRMAARPRTAYDDGRAAVVLDAQGGLGHPVAEHAMHLAADRAARFGVGVVTVRNSHHFGAAGYYARLAAGRGMLGLVTTSAVMLAQAPTGGAERRLGTNPVAFAAPRAGDEPFVLDMSTSVVALNKVKVYALRDEPLPGAWVADDRGEPIHDSAVALRSLTTDHRGGLAPLGGPSTVTGGHKGYGLAMMVQILSAALCGAGLPGSGPPDDVGHFFLAIDPAAFGAVGTLSAYVDDLVDLMHDTPRADPRVPVLVAGERGFAESAVRRAAGIPLPDALVTALRDVCTRNDVPFVLRDLDAGAGATPGSGAAS